MQLKHCKPILIYVLILGLLPMSALAQDLTHSRDNSHIAFTGSSHRGLQLESLGKIQVVSLTINSEDDIISAIEDIIFQKPELDLIITPEYSLHPDRYNEQTPRIRIDCGDGRCFVQNVNGGEDLIYKIEQIQEIAALNDVNIILGTLPTEESLSNPDPDLNTPLYNSLIVIDRQGEIIFKKMKATGSDWCIPAKNGKNWQCQLYPDIDIDEARQKALSSSRPFTLTSKTGERFSVFSSICADIADTEMLVQNAGIYTDLLIWPTVMGPDFLVETISREVQAGDLTHWPVIKNYIVTPFITDYGVIKNDGFFITADPHQSGLINLAHQPLEELEITEDYVYGKITLPEEIIPDWPMFRKDSSHKGFNAYKSSLTPPLTLAWTFTEEYAPAIEASPIISDGRVYISTILSDSYGSAIIAFDLDTGEPLWDYLLGAVWSTPAVYEEKVYVGSWDGYLHALDTEDGSLIWKTQIAFPWGRAIRSSPVVVDNVVYIGTMCGGLRDDHGAFYSIDADDGAILGRYEFVDGSIYSSPAVVNNVAYFTVMKRDGYRQYTPGGKLYAIDISDPSEMTELWSVELECDKYLSSSPVVHNGLVYYVWDELTIYDGTNGDVKFTYELPVELNCSGASYGYEFSSPAIAYGNIYIARCNTISAFSITKLLEGNSIVDSQLWTYSIPIRPDTISSFTGSSPAVANGYVYIEAGDVDGGAFYTLDAFTGEMVWHYDQDGSGVGYCIASPAVTDSHAVFISAHDFDWSGVYVFKNAGLIYGDVSGNGTVSGYDASLILQYLAEIITFDERQLKVADVTQSGEVTQLDAEVILKYVVWLIEELPIKNHAPALSTIGDKEVQERQPLEIKITAQDPEPTPLSFSVNNLPQGASFDAATQTFSWFPDDTQVGSHQVEFIVTDYELRDSETITIDVIPSTLYGDVNLDKVVNILDITALERLIAEVDPITPLKQKAGDVSGDGTLSALDLDLIMQYLVQLIDKFPVEGGQLPAGSVNGIGTTDIEAEVGQSIEIPLKAVGFEDVLGMDMEIEYDNNVLEFKGIDGVGIGLSTEVKWYEGNPGDVKVIVQTPVGGGISGTGDVAVIRFDVKEQIEPTNTQVEIKRVKVHEKMVEDAFSTIDIRLPPPQARSWVWPRKKARKGQRVFFYGRGKDAGGGRIVEYSWRSSIDGELRSSRFFVTKRLSVGSHTIYFKVKNDKGVWSEEVERRLIIQPPRRRPW